MKGRSLIGGVAPLHPFWTRGGQSTQTIQWRLLARLACAIAALATSLMSMAQPVPAPEILRQLRSFREMGSVLYLAAHPDDENTELIAYFARGRNYRTAYLSLTRGDGGQNVLGPEFGAEIGVIRTQELLAARRIDGGRQFFSRAVDFGFSKDYRQTLRIWDRHQVLSDIVRVIRQFRPDVLITRFSPIPGRTHGHHTASTILAMEAFKLAGDPKAFPEQQLKPWQPKRILWNVSIYQKEDIAGSQQVRITVAGNDPVSGESFAEIAGRSRSMHKTQGFDNFTVPRKSGPRFETFQLLDGAPMTSDILDGVDTTWSRVPGGSKIGNLADGIITEFNLKDPAGSVPGILKLRGELAALPLDDSVVLGKRAQLDRILQECLALEVQTTIPQAEVVPGEMMKLHHSAVIYSSIPVRWVAVRYPGIQCQVGQVIELLANKTRSFDSTQTLPVHTPLSQPYWLRQEGTAGMFRVDDPSLIGRPENPPAFPIEQVFEVGDQTLVIPDEPVQVTTNSANREVRRRIEVIPPVSLDFVSDLALFAPGTSHPVAVEVMASRDYSNGRLRLEAPPGWNVSPAEQSFHLATAGDRAQLQFAITAPSRSATASIIADAEIGGVHYGNQHVEIDYPHIPPQLLQPPARLKAVSLELATRGRMVGYLPGAGDRVAESLKQMGYSVKVLDDTNLTPEQLRGLDAVVLGVRALNVRNNIASQLPVLFAYVGNGGTIVAQYNRPDGLKTDKLAPFELHLSADRVTDENAPVTFLTPDHPVLNTPNKITSADFDGWVQERGIYFPNQWDDHFTPILALNDPGESTLKGGLLVAQYGEGYFVYTGLVFFRELPAGVPGAFRLFANLISLGK
ncbi:MAG: PIG-L family deacetylase [Verrucomicrobia bacterium]|nr:PIG-L family deacetylase [Verrucomicrobiota bacterium]